MRYVRLSSYGDYKVSKALEIVIEMIDDLKEDPGDAGAIMRRLVDVRETLLEVQAEVTDEQRY